MSTTSPKRHTTTRTTVTTILWFAVPVVWMACLYAFSTDWLSTRRTGAWIEPAIRDWLPFIPRDRVWLAHLYIRKAAHVCEYAVLAMCWAMAFVHVRHAKARWGILAAAVLSVGYAMFDEWHQTHTRLRNGTPKDVLFDAAGVLFGLTLFLSIRALLRWWNQRRAGRR